MTWRPYINKIRNESFLYGVLCVHFHQHSSSGLPADIWQIIPHVGISNFRLFKLFEEVLFDFLNFHHFISIYA